jgi:hypothetical protein
MLYRASEIEWSVVRHGKEKNKELFRKSETLRVAGGQKGQVVVAVCQCQN